MVANAEADRALAEERQRADRLNEQVEALSAEVVRAEKQAEAVVGRAERAEAGRDAERARADALRSTIDELKAEQALMTEMHARELAVAQHDALAAKQAVAELRPAEAERRARGLLARLRAAWRGNERHRVAGGYHHAFRGRGTRLADGLTVGHHRSFLLVATRGGINKSRRPEQGEGRIRNLLGSTASCGGYPGGVILSTQQN